MNIIEQEYRYHCQNKSDINEHLPTIKKYATECEHITEMGVRWVVSTWALLSGKPKKLISYDIQNPLAFGIDITEVYNAASQENIDFKFIEKDVLEVKIEQTDLLFLDTRHVWEQVEVELKLHSSSVNKYIIFHDTTSYEIIGEIPGHKGIWGAILEFLDLHKGEWVLHERFINNNGLTIIKRINESI